MFVTCIFRRKYPTYLKKLKEHSGLALKQTRTRSCPMWGVGSNPEVWLMFS